MQNENNDCIRYLMKEMDPSEELLMERAMMRDENLLIEVESMRQTFSKLDGLPQIEPPSHIQQSVLQKASDHAAKKHNSHSVFKPIYKYAVAATLALTVTAGGMWFFVGTEGEKDSSLASSASNSSLLPQESSALVTESSSVQRVSAKGSKVEPWIDRNNVLHFKDQFTNQKNISTYETILQRSTQKLQLIENPVLDNQPIKSIQLTGSGN